MKTNATGKTLHNLYRQALEKIDFLSHVLMGDTASDDRSTELLLLESVYAAACFSRAVRKVKAEESLGPKIKDLCHYLDQGLKLMEGSGEKRFKKFLAEYFTGQNLLSSANHMISRIKQQIEDGVFQDAKNEELFEDEVLDYFIFFDRFACMSHPKDSPFGFVKKELKGLKPDVDSFFNTLNPVFNACSDMITTYRDNVFIPNEPAYGYWYRVSHVSVEDFLAEYERIFSTTAYPERVAFLTLLASLPDRLKNGLAALGLEKKIEVLASIAGQRVADFLSAVQSQLEIQPEPALAYVSTWSEKKKSRTQGKKKEKLSDDSINLLRSRYGDDLKKALAKVEKDVTFSERERKELTAFVCVLSGDRKTLEKMLKKQPAKKKIQ
ncbi:MAG: hypothetical protein WCQ99_03130 [Pseudomonadota bacterium]